MRILARCADCARHFRPHEPRCPFCASSERIEPRPTLLLPPAYASRSRRYAASAAILASGVAVSCGQSVRHETNDAPAGGAENGGSAGAGRAGSGSSGVGGGTSGASGTSGAGGTTVIVIPPSGDGGMASAGFAGGGPVTGDRACDPSMEYSGCRTSLDCPDPMDVPAGTEYRCEHRSLTTGCAPSVNRCPAEGCAPGFVCRADPCYSQSCVPACPGDECTGSNHCVGSDCLPRPCEEEGAAPCVDGFTCDPSYTASADHCRETQCDEGYECPSYARCVAPLATSDRHGCSPRPCSVDTDCGSCGYCVEQLCAPMLGRCELLFPAMPYGCVWPDEELV
jgi:hypothetical protein